MDKNKFIEEVFEIAFGDDAINRGFSYDDVLDMLRNMNDIYADYMKESF